MKNKNSECEFKKILSVTFFFIFTFLHISKYLACDFSDVISNLGNDIGRPRCLRC